MSSGNCEICGIWDSSLVEGACPACMAKCKSLPIVIGIAGPARCGKDTVADIIMKNCTSYRKYSFADPIKEMLKAGLGLTDEQLWGDNKEAIDSRYDVSPRYMMQTLGTEWGRALINDNLWVVAMEQRIDRGMIIPDVRFENEAAFVRKYGVLLHVTGRGGIEGDHISESGVSVEECDRIVTNDGTPEDLERVIKGVF